MFTMRIGSESKQFDDPATLVGELARTTLQMIETGDRGVVVKASTGVGKSTHYIAELYKLVKPMGYKIFCS